MLYLVNTDWYLSNFDARVIFHGLSTKPHDIRKFSTCVNVVTKSRRVAGKLSNHFRAKQNTAYALAMKKQPIARNNCLDSSTFAGFIANMWGQSQSSS